MDSATYDKEMNEHRNFKEMNLESFPSNFEASAYLEGNTYEESCLTECDLTSTRNKSQSRLDTAPTDEVLLKLSRINGAINKMTREQLQAKLDEFRLNTSGIKDVLKKRLKNHYKRQRFAQSNKSLTENEIMKYDYLVVIDFEATCSETNENFVHEIIEFPAVLVDTRNQVVSNIFQRFCKPRVNPRLTEFCTKLTGISQQQVDKAKDFTDVFKEFEEWMAIHKLGTDFDFAILTDGPWDMSRFLKTQTELSGVAFPPWAKQWINLRKAYTAFYSCGRVNLHQMIDELGMKFQGRPHCGLDDARNIAAIVIRLLQDGCIMRINEHYRDGEFTSRKSNGTNKPSRQNRSQTCQKNKVREIVEVEQEGENLHSLLEYLKIQKS